MIALFVFLTPTGWDVQSGLVQEEVLQLPRPQPSHPPSAGLEPDPPPPSPLFLLFLRLPGISFFLAAGRGRVRISEATCSSAHQSEFCNIWMRNGRPHQRHFHSSAQLSVSLIYPRVCLDFPGDMEVKSTNQIVSNLVWSVCFRYICRACKSVAGGSVGASSTTQAAPRLQMFLNEKTPALQVQGGVREILEGLWVYAISFDIYL